MTYILIGTAVFLVLLGLVVGYLLGWRSGHLLGIDRALSIYLYRMVSPPDDEVTQYTKEEIVARNPKLLSVKKETMRKIEEMRKSGLK